MKIIITTSNRYLHIIPVFTYLFNKYWGGEATIVGYDAPENLPSNFIFYSLGEQIGGAENFTRDLRKYFAEQEQWFIWLMEDTFVKSVDKGKIENIQYFLNQTQHKIGRFNLTSECVKQDHVLYGNLGHMPLYANSRTSLYRLSTQPSIWNRDYVLQYMQKDLNCWQFESQSDYQNDDWTILGFGREDAPLKHNEGVRKTDIYKYDLNGFNQEDIDYINALSIKP